jgi:hypothetical protein
MASVIRQEAASGVRYSIQLPPSEDIKRPKITLGRITKKAANTIRVNIQNLIKRKMTGDSLTLATQEWLDDIPDSLWGRLGKLELVEMRQIKDCFTVQKWTDQYI